MSGSASLTKRPAKSVIRSSNFPSRRTGFWSVIPYCSPSRKSSSPKAIAVWTRPVPSSVVTKSAEQHRVAARAVVGDVVEGRLVGGAGQGLAREVGQDLDAPRRATVSSQAHVASDQAPRPRLSPGPHVFDLRAGGDRGVGDQRPRGRRPDQQLVAGLQRRLRDPIAGRGLADRQLHVDGGVLDVVVAERDLVRGERGAAARAVGDDLVALVEPLRRPRSAAAPTRPTRCSRSSSVT